jgi:hypothetical protein
VLAPIDAMVMRLAPSAHPWSHRLHTPAKTTRGQVDVSTTPRRYGLTGSPEPVGLGAPSRLLRELEVADVAAAGHAGA